MLNSLIHKTKDVKPRLLSGKNLFCLLLPIAYCLLPIFSLSQTWNKVGTGVCCGTTALGIYKNELYFGGGYSWPSPFINIAKWDGNVWTPLDSALGWPYCFFEYNNELYMGGDFNSIQGTWSCGIAKWNGTQWLALGSGLSSCATYYIKDITVFNGDIYAAGRFSGIGGINTRGIAKWNGTNWSAVGGGLLGGFPTPDGQALLYKNDLYVGGDFTMAGNVPANYIARWNGTKWDSVDGGIPGEVLAFIVDTINDFLYAGGRFAVNGVARWDGFAWTMLDSGINANIYSLSIYHHQLYAVGGLQAIGGEGVARWNGIYWEAVGGGTDWGTTVYSAQVYKDELYIGGGFIQVGNDTSIKYIARWYSPPDTTCKFVLQPIIESMLSLTAPNGVSDTFYYTDSVAVQFYNNIASASSWQWDFGDGDIAGGKTPVHYYSAAGTYTVSVIVNYPYGPKGPCIDTACKTITVIYGIQGVNEIKTSVPDFKVFPNPAKEEIKIQLKDVGSGKPVMLTVRNASGQEILKQSFKKEIIINTSKWKKGLYIIEICSPFDRCRTEKAVIE